VFVSFVISDDHSLLAVATGLGYRAVVDISFDSQTAHVENLKIVESSNRRRSVNPLRDLHGVGVSVSVDTTSLGSVAVFGLNSSGNVMIVLNNHRDGWGNLNCCCDCWVNSLKRNETRDKLGRFVAAGRPTAVDHPD
jgi:hypothetical protein